MSDEKPHWPKRPAILLRVPQKVRVKGDEPPREIKSAARPFFIKPARPNRERKKTELMPVPVVVQHSRDDYEPVSAPKRFYSKRRKPILVSMSIRNVNDRSGASGFPTVFRPQVGAVGGDADFRPKTSIWALFVAALATLIAANSAPMDRIVATLQSEGTTAMASTAEKKQNIAAVQPLFIPLFGPQAVHTCSLRCGAVRDSAGAESCRNACEKLSLSEYARRIRLVDTTPKSDAELITQSCEPAPDSRRVEASVADWEVQAKTSYQLLRELAAAPQAGNFARARLSYGQLTSTLAGLKYPPANSMQDKQRQLTDRMLRASCLWAHSTLIDLAVVLVRQNNDDYSLRYYSELKQFVQRPLTQLEPALLKDARTFLLTNRVS